ncbi:MAG TPA: phosphatidylserine decarboxylase [Phycisphaerae bacterium]|nr:phosphatidylserine decarboxylase [Phycisphaerae bacterium]HPZ96950.1 phosphatidylserine decarboxylase [Phycisphaerae bacterium]
MIDVSPSGILERLRLTPMGRREILLIGAGSATLSAVGVAVLVAQHLGCGLLILVSALLGGIGLLFFRDPRRCAPADPKLLVAPADGRATDITCIEHDPELGTAAVKISIFLSVLDVHVNRSPCSGIVQSVEHRRGHFFDARDARAGTANEANTIVIKPDESGIHRVIVRQIAGRIARRIVCLVRPGDRVECGQRIGMIKFGSRTDLLIPSNSCEPMVNVGDRACGAVTVLARCMTGLMERSRLHGK